MGSAVATYHLLYLNRPTSVPLTRHCTENHSVHQAYQQLGIYVIGHVLVKNIGVKPPPYISMAPDLGSQLALPPGVVMPLEKGRVHIHPFLASSDSVKAPCEGTRCLFLRQVPPHTLEERHTVPLRRPWRKHHLMGNRLACTTCDYLEGLADIDHEGARYVGSIHPGPIVVQNLETPHLGRGCLQKECPPTGRVLMGTDALQGILRRE